MSCYKIPLSKADITEKEISLVVDVLNSGWLASGKKVELFENLFSDYINVEYSVALNSCTSALMVSLLALNLKGEVILPSFTFVASANAIIAAGCKPVFAEINSDTYTVNPDSIENSITKNTVAIMPVHFAGLSADMVKIKDLAKKYNLSIIEDSAEAIGAEIEGRKTGSFGIGCFSFFPTKNITTGEGGMITSNNKDFTKRVRSIIAHGVDKDIQKKKMPWFRDAIYPGFNLRMTDLQAAIGIAQLRRLDLLNNKRRKNARILTKLLSGFENIKLPVEPKGFKHVYQMYCITLTSSNIDRGIFINFLRRKSIEASVHFYPPVHLTSFYKKYLGSIGKLEKTEYLSSKIVTLPLYPQLTVDELEYIAVNVKKALKYAYKNKG